MAGVLGDGSLDGSHMYLRCFPICRHHAQGCSSRPDDGDVAVLLGARLARNLTTCLCDHMSDEPFMVVLWGKTLPDPDMQDSVTYRKHVVHVYDTRPHGGNADIQNTSHKWSKAHHECSY